MKVSFSHCPLESYFDVIPQDIYTAIYVHVQIHVCECVCICIHEIAMK